MNGILYYIFLELNDYIILVKKGIFWSNYRKSLGNLKIDKEVELKTNLSKAKKAGNIWNIDGNDRRILINDIESFEIQNNEGSASNWRIIFGETYINSADVLQQFYSTTLSCFR